MREVLRLFIGCRLCWAEAFELGRLLNARRYAR